MDILKKREMLLLLLVTINIISVESVKVKLRGGTGANQGNVYVRYRRRWGLVCDDRWNIKAAHVVCRQLGFPKAKTVTWSNYYRSAPHEKIFLDDVVCSGSESNLADCKHRPWLSHNCNIREAAGVICEVSAQSKATTTKSRQSIDTTPLPTTTSTTTTPTTTTPTTSTTSTTTVPTIATTQIVTREPYFSNRLVDTPDEFKRVSSQSSSLAQTFQQQKIYSINILGGRVKNEGYVKVKLMSGRSGTICSDEWGLNEATVVCRELGLKYASRETQSDFFKGSHEEKVISSVQCRGTEKALAECNIQTGTLHCSRANRVAGVLCTNGKHLQLYMSSHGCNLLPNYM